MLAILKLGVRVLLPDGKPLCADNTELVVVSRVSSVCLVQS